VGLGGEVVDLVGPDLAEQAGEARGVGEVAVVAEKSWPGGVGFVAEVVDSLGGPGAGAAEQSVHLVALGEEQFGEVGAVLAGESGDEGDGGHQCSVRSAQFAVRRGAAGEWWSAGC
jgi:hypothetical protein